MESKNLYYLVEWEHNENAKHSFCVINSSRIYQPKEEVHTGKLVTLSHNGVTRRAKVLGISDNYEKLQLKLLRLEENNIAANIALDSSMPPLGVTIEKLRHMMFPNDSEENTVENTSSSGSPYNIDDSDEYNARLPPSTSCNSQAVVTTKTKARNSKALNSVPRNISNARMDGSLQTEFTQLQEELSRAQMQYLEINHYVEALKAKVDSVSLRIKQWQDASGYSFNEMTSRSDGEGETTPAKVAKVMPNGRRLLDDHEEEESSENENDMVNIGSGKTKVPRYVLNQIDWRSHTIATRKLLMAIFPRKVLATHSLTGKSSPAFTDKPAKLCLDTAKVRDIVITVSEKCNVNPSLVRGAITTKCADENKMFRVREAKKNNKKKKTGNQENVPPQTDLDESQTEPKTPEIIS